MAATSRGWAGWKARVGGGCPQPLRTCGTARWRAHSSELSGLLPPHGGARASLLPPKHGLSERLSPPTAAPPLPHDGLEEAGGDGGSRWGAEPVQAAGGTSRAPRHLPCNGVSPSHQSCRPPTPSMRWPPPVLEGSFQLVLQSRKGRSSPRPQDAHW